MSEGRALLLVINGRGKKGKGNRPDLISVVKKKHLIQSEEGAILISE